ncbi:ArsR/SmtB family transcription factor [Pseudonocardia sp. CA-107938]|uniref:ArsR/SmtB family transcription factor n=1 Tax=Pseudonocardia sp. CA-107938 TaxID=3240021 RepID=UPI003D8C020C
MPEPKGLITEPQRLRAMSHPTRLAILELLAIDETATATRCAELTGESVASCSYHLGMLAKYGFIEAVEGPGREKPWRLLQREQSWTTRSLDPEGALAAEALTETFIDHVAEQMKAAFRRSGLEPEEWREANGSSGAAVYLTPDELRALKEELLAIAGRYEPRNTDPSLRPPGSRPVRLFMARWLARPYDGPAHDEESS